jgi:hypothetical protein
VKLSNLAVYQTPKMTWPSIVTEIGDVVAECYTNDKVVLAMAAAPELLEALRAACNDIELLLPLTHGGDTTLTDKGVAETRSHLAIYRAAIAKAKGVV